MWSGRLARYFLMRGRPPRRTPSPTVIARASHHARPQENRAYLGSRQTLPESTTVRVTAPGGTDLTFRSRDWQLCGLTEVLTAPVEGSAEGVIVADLSDFCGLVSAPIELQLEGGRLVSMRCPDPTDRLFRMYVEEMERRFDEGEANRRLAEVGVGGMRGPAVRGSWRTRQRAALATSASGITPATGEPTPATGTGDMRAPFTVANQIRTSLAARGRTKLGTVAVRQGTPSVILS